MESKEQKEETNQKQTHKYRGQSGDGQRGGGLGSWENGVKGSRSTN